MDKERNTFAPKEHEVLYLQEEVKGLLAEKIYSYTGIENPDFTLQNAPDHVDADYGVHMASIAKMAGWNPKDLTLALSLDINSNESSIIQFAEAQGAYLNIKLNSELTGQRVLDLILKLGKDYGKENIGQGKIVVVDMSSPNIAKRMNYGHLRSTIIGDSIAKLEESMGHEVVKDNHIGDWGTQFGKLIVATKKWGSESIIKQSADPVGFLQKLYVKFHTEAEKEEVELRAKLKEKALVDGFESVPGLLKAIDEVSSKLMERKGLSKKELNMDTILEDALDQVTISDLEKQGREWFKKLETGNSEARKIWELCVDLSLKEFDEIYKMLGVKFDKTLGESFYENMLPDVIQKVKEKGIGKNSDGALIIDMTDKKLGVAIIQKTDGTSVYMTRDVATAMHRETIFKANKIIYVVGDDQKLYFQQLFEILRRLDMKVGDHSKHVYFGMVTLPDGKMSTRKGRTILLQDVIKEGLKRAEKTIQNKNPKLYGNVKLKKEVARIVAIGALKWNDLSQHAKRKITFDWDEALNFDGYSAPYVQYATVRALSILNKAKYTPDNSSKKIVLNNDYEKKLVNHLLEYPKVLKDAWSESNPAKVASYVYGLAKLFNSFYKNVHVLDSSKELKDSKLKLIAATVQILFNSMEILGIEIPPEM